MIKDAKARKTPLLIKDTGLAERISEVLERLKREPDKEPHFFDNPTHLFPCAVLPEQRTSVTNHLLYSVLNSQRLLTWIQSYAAKHRDDPPTKDQFLTEFCQAVIEHGGNHRILVRLRAALQHLSVGGGTSPEAFISNSAIFASGIAVSTNQRQGIAQDHRSTQNFNPVPTQHPTTNPQVGRRDQRFGRLTILGSHYVRAAIELLASHAAEIEVQRESVPNGK
jgi:hypothetical protein